jgi:hypothetical protein
LVEADSILTTLAGNVYFEPEARNNWHSHPAGQILIITGRKLLEQLQWLYRVSDVFFSVSIK